MNGEMCRFGLIVTGRGEAKFLPNFFRGLTARAHCRFQVIGRAEQSNPITSPARLIRMGRQGKQLPTTDEQRSALPIRAFLQEFPNSFALFIDDLEAARRPIAGSVFGRCRQALDVILGPCGLQQRACVHFLVNMLEAYYFAHADAVNSVAGAMVLPGDHPTDVEQIGHPKGELRHCWNEFDEIEHGRQIVPRLDLEHVLSRPSECCALRTMIDWCVAKLSESDAVWDVNLGRSYRLSDGCRWDVTSGQ